MGPFFGSLLFGRGIAPGQGSMMMVSCESEERSQSGAHVGRGDCEPSVGGALGDIGRGGDRNDGAAFLMTASQSIMSLISRGDEAAPALSSSTDGL